MATKSWSIHVKGGRLDGDALINQASVAGFSMPLNDAGDNLIQLRYAMLMDIKRGSKQFAASRALDTDLLSSVAGLSPYLVLESRGMPCSGNIRDSQQRIAIALSKMGQLTGKFPEDEKLILPLVEKMTQVMRDALPNRSPSVSPSRGSHK